MSNAMSNLFFLLIVASSSVLSSPVTRYATSLSQNQWMAALHNPCHAQSGQDAIESQLNIEGREIELRSITGNMLSRLRKISSTHLVSC